MNDLEKDLAQFMKGRAGEGETNAHLLVPQPILKDLVGSRLRLGMTYVFAAIIGYLASLAVCAQCSLGLTDFSWKTAALIHSIPDPWCPMVCGFIFGISPIIVSLLTMSRFQHRFLLFRMAWIPLLVPLLGNIFMLLSGPIHEFMWYVLWFAAAAGTPYLGEITIALFLRQKNYVVRS